MKNSTAIITGGSRGIGKAIALLLASEGVNVVIGYAGNEAAALETKAECEALGVGAIAVKADVSVSADCDRLLAETITTFGRVDMLVNNAGITKDGLAARMSDEDFGAVVATNLNGSFYMMRAVARPMMKQRSGRILNISSVVGLMGNAGQINYCASKAGVIGMTKSLARELAPRGITVNALAPGFIETDMTSVLPEDVSKKIKGEIPLGVFGKADDVAKAARFLLSKDAGYITGQVLAIDGGMSMM